jgi:hypothetical protein
MYIPISYWQSSEDKLAQANAKFFVTGAVALPATINFTYEQQPLTYTFTTRTAINNTCVDVTNETAFYKNPLGSNLTTIWLASQPYFCSAAITSSAVPCTSYLFFYDSLGCGFPGEATARYYDCDGNLVERLVRRASGVNTEFTACATAFGNQPCILTQLSTGSCTPTQFSSSQCCVNYPPNTGPEAWYIDIVYSTEIGDAGTFYFNYINQNGELINDTITFAEGTKRIISQTSAFWLKNINTATGIWIKWNLISKFPGQVIPYAYKDIPARYTFTLKRNAIDESYGIFNWYGFQNTGSLGVSGSLLTSPTITGSIGSTLQISSYNVPIPVGAGNLNIPNTWVTVASI